MMSLWSLFLYIHITCSKFAWNSFNCGSLKFFLKLWDPITKCRLLKSLYIGIWAKYLPKRSKINKSKQRTVAYATLDVAVILSKFQLTQQQTLVKMSIWKFMILPVLPVIKPRSCIFPLDLLYIRDISWYFSCRF